MCSSSGSDINFYEKLQMQHQPENYLLKEVAKFVSADTFVLQCLLTLCHFRITSLIF